MFDLFQLIVTLFIAGGICYTIYLLSKKHKTPKPQLIIWLSSDEQLPAFVKDDKIVGDIFDEHNFNAALVEIQDPATYLAKAEMEFKRRLNYIMKTNAATHT